jgi:RAD51-like protein 1
LTVKDVCLSSDISLVERGVPLRIAADLIAAAARSYCPKAQTAYDLARKQRSLGTTLHVIDRALGGGLPCGMLTEISGPPGAGKSTFTMFMAALCAKQKLNVLFFDTEGSFSASRLAQMVSAQNANVSCLAHVLVVRISSIDDLAHHIETLDSKMAETGNVQLVVIDSIASIVRREVGGSTVQRNSVLAHCASKLKSVAEV